MSPELDPEIYWDAIYSATAFAGGKEPNSFLQRMLPRIRQGKILDIAMGEGVNAAYLAQKGSHIKGFDISGKAISRAVQLAKDTGVEIEAKRTDLDLFLMGVMEFDSVIMTYFKPSVTRFYGEIIKGLKQGGTLLVESFMTEEMEGGIPKNESFRNFYYGPNELLSQLKDLRILFYHEGLVDQRHLVQCLAMKPLDKDAVKYGLFDMHTKQIPTQESPHLRRAEDLFKKK